MPSQTFNFLGMNFNTTTMLGLSITPASPTPARAPLRALQANLIPVRSLTPCWAPWRFFSPTWFLWAAPANVLFRGPSGQGGLRPGTGRMFPSLLALGSRTLGTGQSQPSSKRKFQ
ncbi:hypothetical protein ACOMHN_039610 [Nucella lapillus]